MTTRSFRHSHGLHFFLLLFRSGQQQRKRHSRRTEDCKRAVGRRRGRSSREGGEAGIVVGAGIHRRLRARVVSSSYAHVDVEGRGRPHMVSLKFCLVAGMSPEQHGGHRHPRRRPDVQHHRRLAERVLRHVVRPQVLQRQRSSDDDTVRSSTPKEDNIRRVVKQAGNTPRAIVDIPLPFPVIETRNPPMKSVTISKTGTRMITIRLASYYFLPLPRRTVKQGRVLRRVICCRPSTVFSLLFVLIDY